MLYLFDVLERMLRITIFGRLLVAFSNFSPDYLSCANCLSFSMSSLLSVLIITPPPIAFRVLLILNLISSGFIKFWTIFLVSSLEVPLLGREIAILSEQ